MIILNIYFVIYNAQHIHTPTNQSFEMGAFLPMRI
jgi:hypothetical protein